MRISELLRKSQEIQAASGDLSVVLSYGEFGFDDLTGITVDAAYFDAFEGSTSGTHCRASDLMLMARSFDPRRIPPTQSFSRLTTFVEARSELSMKKAL